MAKRHARKWKGAHGMGLMAALAAVIALSLAMGYYFNTGASQYNDWDFYVYIYYSHVISAYGLRGGLAVLRGMGLLVFTGKYILLAVPALLYSALGINTLSISLFGAVCLVGAMASIFCIAREIGGGRAGIFAAAAFGIAPATILELGSAGDGLPLAFFSALAALLLVKGWKGGKPWYIAAAGAALFVGAMASSAEIFISLLAFAAFLAYESPGGGGKALPRGSRLRPLASLCAGSIIGLAILIAADQLILGSPLAYFLQSGPHATVNYFTQPQLPLGEVIGALFPAYYAYSYGYFWITPYSIPLPTPRAELPHPGNFVGLLGYLMAACAAYLAYRKDRGMEFPLIWLVVVLLYLGAGTDSLGSGFIYFNPRFLMGALPPLSIVVGLGLDRMAHDAELAGASRGGGALIRPAAYLCLAALAALVAVTSFYIAQFCVTAWKTELQPFVQAGSLVMGLPNGTTVYVSSAFLSPGAAGGNGTAYTVLSGQLSTVNFYNLIAVALYGGYGHRFNTSYVYTGCGGLRRGSYVLVINDLQELGYTQFPVNQSAPCAGLVPIPLNGGAGNPLAGYGIQGQDAQLKAYEYGGP